MENEKKQTTAGGHHKEPLKAALERMVIRRRAQSIALAASDAAEQTKLIEDLGKTQLAIKAIAEAIKERSGSE